MAKKAKAPFNKNATIRGALRRAFARFPVIIEIKNEGRREVPKYKKDGSRAKRDSVQYHCQVCNNWVSSTKISVDHKDPVISTDEGFVDWNTFIARLDCDKVNLQRICDDCHQIKTNAERWDRKLKADLPLIEECEQLAVLSRSESHRMKMIEGIEKLAITKKKLENYPSDIVERLLRLKSYIPKKAKK
jgi:hypothetical protein